MKSQWHGKAVLFYVMWAAPLEWQRSLLALFTQCNQAEQLEGFGESTGAN